MKNLKDFNSKIEFVLTDIDDTLTTEGQLHSEAYDSLWKLHDAGLKVIPITGRPAGWCEMIARQWPVSGVVGENGGFYFRYSNKKMHRWFHVDEQQIGDGSIAHDSSNSDQTRASDTANKFSNDAANLQISSSANPIFSSPMMEQNRKKLDLIKDEVLSSVKGSALASDQFCRLMDLAIDFCEDVPHLKEEDIQKIVNIFTKHGAQAKVSSIHVNGWFGDYNKVSTTFQFLSDCFNVSEATALKSCIFVGDSPNDEPMFKKFPHSFGVANISAFKNSMKHLPTYISTKSGGQGFAEIAKHILSLS